MLAVSYNKFVKHSHIIETRSLYIEQEINALDDWEVRYLCRSLIDDLWQSWIRFVRDVIIKSCYGCTTRRGTYVTSRPSDNSWQRVGYEAIEASRGKIPKPIKKISSIRQEPTWGDIGKIIDIIVALDPSNKNELLNAFGLPLRGPKHLQIVRNACSHTHNENMADVKKISIFYIGRPIMHPVDLIWRVEASSGNICIYKWIDDLIDMATQATIHP